MRRRLQIQRARLTLAVACVVASVGATTVDAQGREQDAVSRELFDGLCGFFGGPPPQVLSGELPKDFPSELIPEHSRVVGTLAGQSTVALFSVPDAAGAAAAVERQAEAAGWRVRPYELDGFLPSVPFDANGPRCHRGRALNVMALPAPNSLLRVDLSENPSCKEQADTSEPRKLPMPRLQAPDGASMMGSGSMSGGSSDGSSYEARSATIRSDWSASALAARFSDQAREEGWSATLVTDRPDLGVWTFERRGADGEAIVALLTVFRLRDGECFAQFQAGSSGGKAAIVTLPSTSPPR